MMFPNYSIKTCWPYILIAAILVQCTLYFRLNVEDPINDDANSAISRAVTESCKQELRVSAKRADQEFQVGPLHLRRSCRYDLNKQRYQKLGCASNSSEGLNPVGDVVTNATRCYELCFSFGHTHAGFESRSNVCYCGSQDTVYNRQNNIQECHGKGEFDWFRIDVGIFRPDRALGLPSKPFENGELQIAFLFMVRGRSYQQILRLLNAVYSQKHIYYIHVDRRDNFLHRKLSDFARRFNNIHIAAQRFDTVWGSPSLLRVILDAINHLSNYDWHYLINLSESDFPIKPLHALETYLGSTAGLIHLKLHNIVGYNFIKKQGLNKSFYQCEGRVWLIGKRHLPKGIVTSGGSDWFALPRDFCLYVAKQNVGTSNSLVQSLVALYNHTILPVESFFHTIALNSHFCDRFIDNNLRITNWNRKQSCKCQHRDVVDWCGCSPLIYRWSDWARLKHTNSSRSLFFTRKFNPAVSSSIIEEIDRSLIQRQPEIESQLLDTRYWESLYEHEYDESSYSSDIMQTFANFTIEQLRTKSQVDFHQNYTLLNFTSAYSHFNRDKFIAYVLQFCRLDHCLQLRVTRVDEFNIRTPLDSCFNTSQKSLEAIEINHGFDTGERQFLNFRPLDEKSSVVVYHEWLINSQNSSQGSLNDTFQFNWRSSRSKSEQLQRVNLKGTSRASRLRLAHRLSIPGPLTCGLWSMVVSYQGHECLRYRFLVFGKSMLSNKALNQRLFDKFYAVDEVCIVDKTRESPLETCSSQSWSSESRKVQNKLKW